MVTPTKDEIEDEAKKLWHFDHPKSTINPEEYELVEGGYMEKGKTSKMYGLENKYQIDKYEQIDYEKLVADCRKIVAKENIYIIRCKHELGQRILQEGYTKSLWGNRKFFSQLAKDIEIGLSTLYEAIRFASKFPDIEKFLTSQKVPEGQHLTWNYIVHNLLYKKKPKLSKKLQATKVEILKIELEAPKPPEINMVEEIFKLAHKIPDVSRRNLVLTYLLDGVYRSDIHGECYDIAGDFIQAQAGCQVADVDFKINFEGAKTVICISGFKEKHSQNYVKFDESIHYTSCEGA